MLLYVCRRRLAWLIQRVKKSVDLAHAHLISGEFLRITVFQFVAQAAVS